MTEAHRVRVPQVRTGHRNLQSWEPKAPVCTKVDIAFGNRDTYYGPTVLSLRSLHFTGADLLNIIHSFCGH